VTDARGVAIARPRGVASLAVLWRFARPHTIVGSAISVGGLYLIAVAELPRSGLGDLFWVLVAAAGVNVAIVGLNQLTDVEIDRVNKPYLPLAAGDLSIEAGRRIVAVAAVVPVVLALTQGPLESAAVLAALAVGAAYSLPPLRLKRFPVAAALSISGVRAAVVNLGVYGHFSLAFGDRLSIPGPVWALTLFVLPFSFAIAVLKDVPDLEGDRRFRIATFTVRLGPRRAARLGVGALVAAYVAMIVAGPAALDDAQPLVLAGGHAAALALLLWWARRADPVDHASFTAFYMRVWVLFFLEYALVSVAVLTG
jgi:homogentisate phytyltransferase/homogentisate geranylgeranyltransferase